MVNRKKVRGEGMTANNKPIGNKKDMLLLILYSPGQTSEVNEPVVGRTRLVKMLFLFKRELLPLFEKGTELSAENFYEFFPWNFGPFSAQVYDDVTFFVLRNFITTSSAQEETLVESIEEWDKWLAQSGSSDASDEAGEYEEESIRLTQEGVAFTRPLFESLSSLQKNALRDFKARLSVAPLRAILKYVYTRYPDTTTRSQIKGEILGHAL